MSDNLFVYHKPTKGKVGKVKTAKLKTSKKLSGTIHVGKGKGRRLGKVKTHRVK